MIELNQFEEQGAKKLARKRAIETCRSHVQAFLDCTKREFLLAWKCKSDFYQLKTCFAKETNADSVHRVMLEILEEKKKRLQQGPPSH